jgi:hypothetical protein
MADNIEVTINEKEKFTGRLIGIITEEECRAVMNTEDAARKLYSAESVSLTDVSNVINKKRFVIATDDYSSDKHREVFISPVIRFLSYRYTNKIFKCEDENDYQLKEL